MPEAQAAPAPTEAAPAAPAAPSLEQALPTPAPEATATTTEKPAEGEAAAPRKATSRDFAALERAKYQAREARRTAEREVAEMKAQLEAATKGSADVEKIRADLAAAQAELEAARKDGLRYSVKHGADPNALIKAYIGDTEPTKAIAALHEEIQRTREESEKKLRETLAERDKESQKQNEQQQRAYIQQAEAREVQSFVQTIAADEAKSPFLCSEFTRDEIAAQAQQIQQWAKTVDNGQGGKGARYSFEEVRDFLEKRAKGIYEQRQAQRSRLLAAAGGSEGVAPPKGAPAAEKKPAAGTGRRSSSPEKPTPPPKLSRLQQREKERQEDLARLQIAAARDAGKH